jgi:[ribosomal protein S5]-alanine N-acetyltransferase
MTSYFLTTPRLGFRAWTKSDIQLALHLWGDAKTTQFIGGPFSDEQILRRLDAEIRNQEKHGVQYWPLFLFADGAHIGCAGLRPYKVDDGVFELGVHLLPEYWGRGFAEEACRAVIEFAFTNANAKALFAGHHPDHASSRRLLSKLGFRFTHEETYAPTGRMHPSYRLDR